MQTTNESTYSPALKGWAAIFSGLRLASLLLAGVLASGCNHQEADSEAPAPKVDGETITFETNSPQLGALSERPVENRGPAITHLTGHLSWNDDVTVRIFTPVAGRVVKVIASLGASISAGDPLAEIDSPDFGQALANARAAAGNLAAADKTFARNKELLEHGAAAQKDVEAAEASYHAAAAERDRAYAVLANYGGSDTNTNSIYFLKSPLTGVVVEKNITPGQEVRADQMLANATQLYAPLFVVSDPMKLWIQLDVSELNLAALHAGQRLRIHSPAYPDKTFEGELENIGDALDPTTRTVVMRGVVNNPERLLKAEMFVTAELDEAQAGTTRVGVEVPATAVFLKGEKHYVFVQEQPREFKRQEVMIGGETENQVLILQGLQAGERVVTDGCILLQQLLE